MKTILIPTDFSEIAKGAIDYAISFTQKEPVKIILLHVYDAIYGFGITINVEEEEGLKRTQLQALINDYKEEEGNEHIEFEPILHAGGLTHIILEVVKLRAIDLVIMGSKGETDAHNQAFGSETASLIRQTNVPVLTIPKGCKFEKIDSILYATDYRERDLIVIEQLIALAKEFDAKITIVHAEKERTLEADIRFRGFASLLKSKYDFSISHEFIIADSLLLGLASFANLHDHAMIVSNYYKKSFFQNLFSESIAEGMSYVSKIPLMVYHA